MVIYINGCKASKKDLALLIERCKQGLDMITDVHTTNHGFLSISTI